MYGISASFPHHKLVGLTLVQVCVGENDLILNFDEQSRILITSAVSVSGVVERTQDFAKVAPVLFRLLGNKIRRSIAPDPKVLLLQFGGYRVNLYDDSVTYESIVVTLPDEEIVI